MKRHATLYCTYHSCFISKQMLEKHGCFEKYGYFEKHKSGKGRCHYMVNLLKKARENRECMKT